MTSVMPGGLPTAARLPFLFAMGLFTIQPWSFQVGEKLPRGGRRGKIRSLNQ